MALTLAGLEIEKTSGYWRAKGFKQPGILERLEREDGYIVHQRREWRMYDPETDYKSRNTLGSVEENTLIAPTTAVSSLLTAFVSSSLSTVVSNKTFLHIC